MRNDPRDQADREVVNELRKAGIRVRSIYDLVNTRKAYPKAVPTLIRLLPCISESDIKAGIARALTVKEARGLAERPLLREFLEADNSETGLKWAIGNALNFLAREDLYDRIVQIVVDRSHGTPRQQLVSWLGKMKSKQPGVAKVLIRLLNDDDVIAHALEALRKLKSVEARSAVEPLLKHSRPLVRREAAKYLAAIDESR